MKTNSETIESKQTAKHTQLPWKTVLAMDEKTSWLTIGTAGHDSICRITGRAWNGEKKTDEENHANAEFIVRACNSHYELVNALKRAEAALEDMRTHWRPYVLPSQVQTMRAAAEEDHRIVSAALAKAQGK